jgi:hypothetical protein
MMMTVARLRRKPRHFHSFTGLTVREFDRLLLEVEPTYAAHLHERRDRPERRRAVGGGHGFSLPVADRLLLGLVYLRLYVSQSLLSYLFGLDESNVSRELNLRLLPVLLCVLPVPLRDAPLRAQRPEFGADGHGKPRKKIRTVEELLSAYPELKEVLVDATEQEVPKPKAKGERKLRYSGKRGRHTVKTQVVTTAKQVLHVFGGLPGRVADVQLLRASGVLRRLPPDVIVRLDRGYEGVAGENPDRAVRPPLKRRRNRSVNLLDRIYNRSLNRLRIPVEHVLSRLKKFGCLSGVFRSPFDRHEDVFCVVGGLVNFKATGQFTLTAD